ncbi:MAG: PIN domain-containing protein [Chitinophagales bacterium]|nr:PIN domain-containing protein [Chitinophagales bacterium]
MGDVFLDTDVAFDILSKRQPHFPDSVKLLQLAAGGKIRLMISEGSLATLFYLSFDIYKIQNAAIKLLEFVKACELVHANKQVVSGALQSAFRNKEDALQYFTALNAGAEYFVTRNIRDYKNAVTNLPVMLPVDLVKNI